MAALKMEWTPSSMAEFDELKKRAAHAGQLDTFLATHQEIVDALSDLGEALVKGELLYTTRKPGGEVRHWICKFISVCYVVRRDDRVGWILKYQAVRAPWLLS